MANVATTKLSSNGQVVIPEDVRKKLHLKSGTKFVVVGDKDVVILKNISPPTLEEFDDFIVKARKSAKRTELKKSDIKDVIAKVRSDK